MELRDYLFILGRRWWLILVGIVIFGGLFGYYAVSQPTSYTAVASVSLTKTAEKPGLGSSNFTYDNYYNLEANDLLTQMAAGWLTDPASVKQIYSTAKVASPVTSLLQYDKVIKFKKLGSSTIEIITSAATSADAEAVANAATKFVGERVTQLVDQGTIAQTSVLISGATSEISKPSTNMYMVVGVVVGIFLALILIMFWEYLSPSLAKK